MPPGVSCPPTLQGLWGRLLFAERITPRWAIGIVLVVAGLLLISRSVIGTAPAAQHQHQHGSSKPGQAAAKKAS